MSDTHITKEELEKLRKETEQVLGELDHEMRKLNVILESDN